MHFKSGNLYGIAGKVGCGKSGLLLAILKQIPYYSGKIASKGTFSYVEQEPIIITGSIKENVLFGRTYNEDRLWLAL